MSAHCPSTFASCGSIGISLTAHKNILILVAISTYITCSEPNSNLMAADDSILLDFSRVFHGQENPCDL